MFAANEGVTPNDKLYVDSVFSTYLYTGNGSTQTITNGIDLAGKGGLVWIKSRAAASHVLTDTSRGATKTLFTDATSAESTYTTGLTAFDSSGFSLGANTQFNNTSVNYASWTFRKAARFFDCGTFTTNGSGSGGTVSHALGVTPGLVIFKRISGTDSIGWFVWHRSLTANYALILNSTAAQSNQGVDCFGATSTTLSPSLEASATYVWYAFAHDTSADGIIQCGSYTINASQNRVQVNLGWEPQWLLIKRTDSTTNGNWYLMDTMRGLVTGGDDPQLYANASSAESFNDAIDINATGFTQGANATVLQPNATYIYLAIRRPNKPPTSGTQVYNGVLVNSSASAQTVDATFPTDLVIKDYRNLVNGAMWFDRLRGLGVSNSPRLLSSTTGAEATSSDVYAGSQTTVTEAGIGTGYTSVDWFFRRAPGFFDVVCYTGTGTNPTNFSHSLAAIPELMIFKKRSATDRWEVYSAALGNTKRIDLNTDGAATTVSIWAGAPTATQFSLTDNPNVNQSTSTFIAYLFASLPGISKVGSYTGNGSSQTINCGFTTGARFILIKRTDSTGDWYVWDSARGIVAANDPHLSLNTTATEVTTNDSVDPDSSGFIVNQNTATNINVSGASYIFLAIA